MRISIGTLAVVGVVALGGLALQACHGALAPVRATPFPADLEYLSPDRLRSSMWVLAAEVEQLERLLDRAEELDSAVMQTQVQGALERMRGAARALDRPGRDSQHPVLNENLDRFVERIERAQRAASHTPPNYYPASSLAGSCFL
ncbi:MAG TPA: hypothetical protein PLW10_21465, partial [Myxococcota bacterium]|nr:hypothetical protein [Myxococcota bacterium]